MQIWMEGDSVNFPEDSQDVGLFMKSCFKNGAKLFNSEFYGDKPYRVTVGDFRFGAGFWEVVKNMSKGQIVKLTISPEMALEFGVPVMENSPSLLMWSLSKSPEIIRYLKKFRIIVELHASFFVIVANNVFFENLLILRLKFSLFHQEQLLKENCHHL